MNTVSPKGQPQKSAIPPPPSVATISAQEAQSERPADFIKVLKAQDGTISVFVGSLWGSMVEFITLGRNKEITVAFRDGTELQA